MSALDKFGVGVDDLDTQDPEFDMVPVVPNRVAHIDADFVCYEIAVITKWEADQLAKGIAEPRTLEDKVVQIHRSFEKLARRVGADSYVAHVTPSGSDKGERFDAAMTKPYQANRSGGEKPEHLDELRAAVGLADTGMVHLDQEADDGMAQANVAAQDAGTPLLSVIVSKDKDLRMAPGLHWDFSEEEIVTVPADSFGWVYIEQHELKSGKMSPKKCLGYGPAFFWAQCLMGDTADNIAGLPLIEGNLLFKYGIGKAGQKARKCGGVVAYDIISKLSSNKEAFEAVLEAFTTSTHEFLNWRTQAPITGALALGGDMQTLWIRHYNQEGDLKRWLTENSLR